MPLTLYQVVTSLGTPLIRLYLSWRMARGKEDSERFLERLGQSSLPRPAGKLLWMHAASVGESLSLLPLITWVMETHTGWSVFITTGTVTSARLMAERLPDGVCHQYIPVDCRPYVRRFLSHWRPDMVLWAESDLWPNLIGEMRTLGIPAVLINGRMSERSFRQWKRFRATIECLLDAFTLILAQSDVDAGRFQALGAAKVEIAGNLKSAAIQLPFDETELVRQKEAFGERPVWLAASTHPGEEVIVGQVHSRLVDNHPGLLSIIVPRHPERGHEVARILREQNLEVSLRSAGQAVIPTTQVYIADTMGELGLFYRLTGIVFVGKSLKGVGGQNPLEPAVLDCALLFGPEMSNFKEIASQLLDVGAAEQVADGDDLADAVERLLDNDKTRTRLANAAKDVVAAEAGVLERVTNILTPFFGESK